RSDLFAMASVLYTCLVGKAPFVGPTIAHTFERTMACDLVPPSVAAPGVPRRVDAFFQRALAFDREQRFADAEAMAHAFRGFADEERASVGVADERAAARLSERLATPGPAPTPASKTLPDLEPAPPPPPRPAGVIAEPPRVAASPRGGTPGWVIALILVGIV